MNTPTHLTLSTGPIIDTLMAAQKTRELWASSYFFSYLMREIMKELKANQSALVEIILPATHLDKANLHGAGLYPDRIYLQIESGKEKVALDEVWKSCQSVVKRLAEKIYQDLEANPIKAGKETMKRNPFGLQDCKNCLNHYVKLYLAEETVKKGENIIFPLSNLADLMDLQPRILPSQKDFPVDADNRNPLQRFFFLANWSFLFKDGFSGPVDGKTKRRFDSLIEVGSRELGLLHSDYELIIEKEIWDKEDQIKEGLEPDEEKIIQRFRKELIEPGTDKTFLRDYHKYVAIVHADGDNVGKIIAAMGTIEKDIKTFSTALLKFSQAATETVAKYGGAPIYMGGDDMLFLAPVCTRDRDDTNKQTHIFNLIHILDEKFDELIFKPFEQKIKEFYEGKETPAKDQSFPSMSYGISIAFHKYPLKESKALSFDNMMQVKNEHEGKNAVQVTLLKHSGQNIPFLIPKSGAVWEAFRSFVSATNNSDAFLNSFTYKLESQREILDYVAGNQVRLENFFKNNFNENYNSNKKFYTALIAFITALSKAKGGLSREDHELLYGALRFVHFIHNPKIPKAHAATV